MTNYTLLTAEQRATVAAQLGDAKPATDSLILSFGTSVANRRKHDHPQWEDLYCMNLSSYMGERVAPVLRRLLDAEDESIRLRARVTELEIVRLDFVQAHRNEALAEIADLFESYGQAMLDSGIMTGAEAAEKIRERIGMTEKDTPSARGESTPAHPEDGLSRRATRLLFAIREAGSVRWTTGRVDALYAEYGYPTRNRRTGARKDLIELARRGLLTAHGPDDDRYFLLTRPSAAATREA
ncbi:hypothetical protein AB0P17_36445 [Streptomyces sp. NPDC088124]|uniref:hypothetical protein n=1 Tax=Streptomyces sp. NPDC088124 TaxID=3154654 RepID=UPI00341EAEB0